MLENTALGPQRSEFDTIYGGKQASANFNYGGPLTEVVLIGTTASLYRNQELKWDHQNMRFSNFDDLDNLIKPVFREGWVL